MQVPKYDEKDEIATSKEPIVINDDPTIKLKESHTRNIIFVGRTRAGKSTIFNILKEISHVPGNMSIFSDTVDPELSSFAVERQFEEKEEFDKLRKKIGSSVEDDIENLAVTFNVSILDTPGLYEVKKEGASTNMRDNTTLKKMIVQCLKYEIAKIHAIFFVCSFDGGVSSEDVSAFVEFLDLFEGAEEKIAMIITRAEELSDKKKEKILEEIKQEKRLKPLLEKIGKNIFFSGCTSKEQIDNELVEEIQSNLFNIEEMRTNIWDFIFTSHEYVDLRKLRFFTDIIEGFEKFLASIVHKDEFTEEEIQTIKKNKTLVREGPSLKNLEIIMKKLQL